MRPYSGPWFGGAPRKYPEPRVGDQFGPWRIVAIVGRGYRGRSDLRLEAMCTCGRRCITYEFNLRKRTGDCRHKRLSLAQRRMLEDTERCGEPYASVRGAAAHGGANGTIASLQRMRLLEWDDKSASRAPCWRVTPAGKEALKQ